MWLEATIYDNFHYSKKLDRTITYQLITAKYSSYFLLFFYFNLFNVISQEMYCYFNVIKCTYPKSPERGTSGDLERMNPENVAGSNNDRLNVAHPGKAGRAFGEKITLGKSKATAKGDDQAGGGLTP